MRPTAAPRGACARICAAPGWRGLLSLCVCCRFGIDRTERDQNYYGTLTLFSILQSDPGHPPNQRSILSKVIQALEAFRRRARSERPFGRPGYYGLSMSPISASTPSALKDMAPVIPGHTRIGNRIRKNGCRPASALLHGESELIEIDPDGPQHEESWPENPHLRKRCAGTLSVFEREKGIRATRPRR